MKNTILKRGLVNYLVYTSAYINIYLVFSKYTTLKFVFLTWISILKMYCNQSRNYRVGWKCQKLGPVKHTKLKGRRSI